MTVVPTEAFVVMAILAFACLAIAYYSTYQYFQKRKELKSVLEERELDEREASILRRAKADAQCLVSTAMAHHYDACHEKDEHFM